MTVESKFEQIYDLIMNQYNDEPYLKAKFEYKSAKVLYKL
jgi:hypothetical protein